MPVINFYPPYYNTAGIANSVAVNDAQDVYFEARAEGQFSLRRRPGIELLSGLTTDIGQGMYWSNRMQCLFVVASGKFYKYTDAFGTKIEMTGVNLDDGVPATFAEAQKLDLSPICYVANNSLLAYTDGATIQNPTDPATPTSTMVVSYNNRVWANDVFHRQDFYVTDVNDDGLNDPTYWSSSVNPFRAAQKPDNIVAMASSWNEVLIWGCDSCEIWQEDGVTPVSPLVGASIEAGIFAPYSLKKADNTWFALMCLQGKRAVVKLSGRSPQVISEPIANELASYNTISDARGMLLFTGGLNMYILNFPTEKKTWAYDMKTQTWTRWGAWDNSRAVYNNFLGIDMVYSPLWNKHMVQTAQGSLYTIDRHNYTDAGATIRSKVVTGWIDHGTWGRKRSDQLIIKLQTNQQGNYKILMRHRDDGRPQWSNYMEIPVSYLGAADSFAKMNRLGTYRSRQYEFVMTDPVDMAIIGLEEDVTGAIS